MSRWPTWEYEGVRRVTYDFGGQIGVAVLIPVCPKCGRFVKADETAAANEVTGLSRKPNATCKRCGRINMPFEGFF